jgi:hypothetical protein
VLEKEFAPQFTAEDLVNLGMFQMYLKLMIDSVSSTPFSASSLPPFPEPVISYFKEIITNSRKQFAEQRSIVEENIKKWHEEGKFAPKLAEKPKVVVSHPKPVHTEKKPEVSMPPKISTPEKPFKKEPLPEIEREEGDDFLPLKEFAKKVSTEEKKREEIPKITEKPKGNMPSGQNLADLKSALQAAISSGAPKEAPKATEKKPETKMEEQPKRYTHEIPEQDLKRVLGI